MQYVQFVFVPLFCFVYSSNEFYVELLCSCRRLLLLFSGYLHILSRVLPLMRISYFAVTYSIFIVVCALYSFRQSAQSVQASVQTRGKNATGMLFDLDEAQVRGEDEEKGVGGWVRES